MRAAHRARVQGVQVRTEIAAFMGHLYPCFDMPEAEQARTNMRVFINEIMDRRMDEKIDL